MFRNTACLAAALWMSGAVFSVSAQTPGPAAAPTKMKLSKQSLKDMRARWSQNKGKLAGCRKEVKTRGLDGDDRWFYIENCMAKS